MKNNLYGKLAWTNIKKNKKLYLPYLISAIFMVVTFFTITTIAKCDSLDSMYGGGNLRQVLSFGIIVIGFFSTIFLFYTNGFLIKQRKKELGLYCILGLEKKHMVFVLFYETMITVLITVGGGLLIGTVLSKLIFLIMLNLINFDIALKLEYSLTAYLDTVILFCAVFLGALVKNVFQVHLANPIELLKGSNKGEREPKASWILAVLGVATLGAGYYMALSITNPVQAMVYFFIAVLLVIVGTNLLFTSGSIFVLKFLKKRKGFYYRPKNFISISGMLYRMKQNAAGLANICILSTMVIVTILSTVSLYTGQKDIMTEMYPRDIEIRQTVNEKTLDKVNQVIDEQIGKYPVDVTFRGQFKQIDTIVCTQNGVMSPSDKLIGSAKDIKKVSSLYILTLDDYNQYTQSNETLASGNDVLIFSATGKFKLKSFAIGNETLNVTKNIDAFNNIVVGAGCLKQALYMVVTDENRANELYHELTGLDPEDKKVDDYHQMIYMDVKGDEDTVINFEKNLREILGEKKLIDSYQGRQSDNLDWYTTYGGFLFIGAYFGILFLMATVLIIYYKQITEGYDDKERFVIMQNVGMSRSEVKKTIHKQILMVFTLPVLIAACHTCFALPMLKRLFEVFSLYNTALINLCTFSTIAAYAVIYAIVYGLTAKAYYRIVES